MPIDPPTLKTIRSAWSNSVASVFISHAHADKSFARPLAKALQKLGIKVWFDEFELQIGDSLSQSLNKGLALADFDVLVLSKSFFERYWTQSELAALQALEASGKLLSILPVWLDIDQSEILEFAPLLADRFALRADDPSKVASSIAQRVSPNTIVQSMLQEKIGDILESDELPTKLFELDKIKPGPVKHAEFSAQFIGRVRLIRAIIEPYISMTMDEWISNFSRDITPHTELIWWEFLSYMQIRMERGLSKKSRTEILLGLFHLLMTSDVNPIAKTLATSNPKQRDRLVSILNECAELWRTDFQASLGEARRITVAESDL
ncbi:MAG: toll/interleukin-1 receptor domain-containing protein [Litorimonas sp.]